MDAMDALVWVRGWEALRGMLAIRKPGLLLKAERERN
jgi:hypothetical protein